MALAHGRSHLLHGLAVADVADLVLPVDLRGGRLQSVLAPPDEHASPATIGQPAGQGGADSRGPACEDSYLHTRMTREATAFRPRAESTTARRRCRPGFARRVRHVAE